MTERSGPCGIGRVTALTLAAFMAMLMAAVSPAAAQGVPPPQTFDLDGTFTLTRDAIFSGLANQIGTLPNPTGGGFTYTIDPGLGVFIRSSESFGPVFANRAETTGRGKITLTTSYSRHTFDEVDGVKLRTGEITSVLGGREQFIPTLGVDLFIFDLVSVRESVRAEVYTLGALYGITDRLDVGITIPILKVNVKERVTEEAFIFCPAVGRVILAELCSNVFLSGVEFQPNDVESTGLGDIVLRGKYNFWQSADMLGGRAGLAFGFDVKVPTGDKGERRKFTTPEEGVDLFANADTQRFQIGEPPRGTGIVRVRPQVIASGSWLGLAPHVNFGAELGTTKGITNDLVYEVGLDYTVFQRVTFSADILGRHAFGVKRPRIVRDDAPRGKANPDTLTGSFGIKVNPVGTLLVFLNFLVPFDNSGIRDDVTPTFGLEWSM